MAFDVIAAGGPYAPLADELMLFGRFVGAWDVASTWWDADGGSRQQDGEWHFAWALGGRAVQDVLFGRDAAPDQRGTTLRAYDERDGTWHVSWYCPARAQFVHLVARRDGDGILIEGATTDGRTRERWSFDRIEPASFRWQGRCSEDGGGTWRLQQEMQVTRQPR
jgi:hypothetical protein